jgi:hypothetical protein
LAATLLGFVDKQREQAGGLNFDVEQDEMNALVEAIRRALTSSAYAEACNLGRSLDQSQAAARITRKF